MLFDTIAAIATPIGTGAISVIRVSGEDAFKICDKCFKNPSGKKIEDAASHSVLYGYIVDEDGSEIDQVLAVVMSMPRTYTGENTVEINCHGGMAITSKVLGRILACGARSAIGGEFSHRAFINGKIDLAGAEGIMDIISASNSMQTKCAINQIKGSISEKISTLSYNLTDISAELMAYIDFPDEDLQDTPIPVLIEKLSNCQTLINSLIKSYDAGAVIKSGIDTAIVGKPNVGKSSIMNMLTGSEKSIVTDIAGTTRDIVEGSVNIGDITLNLMDTAGIRTTNDTVEAIGVERSIKSIDNAKLILAIFDTSRDFDKDDNDIINIIHEKNYEDKTIAIINKTDLSTKLDFEKIKSSFKHIVYMSAVNGEGSDKVYEIIKEMFFNNTISNSDDAIITNARHYEQLSRASEYINNALTALKTDMTADIVSVDLDNAIESLGQITGNTVSEEIVSRIFEKFCVGK